MDDHLISIILPAHNQADHIGDIVDAYLKALSQIRCQKEYLLVANGCQDNTADICHQLSQHHEEIRVFESRDKGWGLAVKLGLNEIKGDLVCYTNTARTSPKDLSDLLLWAIDHPNFVVKAVRQNRGNLKRHLGSLLYNLQCRLLFDLPWQDINGTPKIFPAQFNRLLELTRDDDLIDLEFNLICRRENYPVIQLPIWSTQRHGGRSTTNYHSAIDMYMGAYQMWWRTRNVSK